jgi:hypothetical protein
MVIKGVFFFDFNRSITHNLLIFNKLKNLIIIEKADNRNYQNPFKFLIVGAMKY